MPRAALTRLATAAGAVALVLLGLPTGAQVSGAVDPHLDFSRLTGGCKACHLGHGVSRSPMLPGPVDEVCFACHDSLSRTAETIARGLLASGARPPLLGSALAQPYTHPLTHESRSRDEPGAVVCTSCHSPHRGSYRLPVPDARGQQRLSPRDPSRFEFELCEQCHGSAGVATQSPLDLSRLFDPSSRSYHPVHAPADERSPSVLPELSGREINCTDCHGNSDVRGVRGPHASSIAAILREEYATTDGSAEQPETYRLCWSCHDRERLFAGTRFPEHRRHVQEEKASCATCHSPHGSVLNRALIRFGEETELGAVGPSLQSGRLAFVSESLGTGSCYLTCHGVDHAPFAYGGEAAVLEARRSVALPVRRSEDRAAPQGPPPTEDRRAARPDAEPPPR